MKKSVFFCFLFILIACNNNNSGDLTKQIKTGTNPDAAIKAEITAIDQEITTTGQEASSLNYSKEDGVTVVVRAHLNNKGKLLRLDEEYNDGPNGNSGTNIFYLKDDKVIASRELFEDRITSENPQFVERLSFYNSKGDIIRTLAKRVKFEEDLDGIEFSEVNKHRLDISRAERALNQQGEFETTFQGFVEAQAIRYIVVGSLKSGFTSAIRINAEDDFIRYISVNEKKHLNRRVQISFEHVMDPSGFQYQSYIQGSFVE
jgi:hypothetical protein